MAFYRTTKDLNYRTGPGAKYTKVGVLKKSALISVVGQTGKWLKIKKRNKYYFCSSTYAKKAVDYRTKVGDVVPKVAKKVLAGKAEHVSGAYKFTGHKVNCSVFVSACLQEAGLLSDNTTVYHTSKSHRKDSIGHCVHNRLKVDHYTWHKTDKKFENLPSSYKKKGCVYVYPSSIGILGSDGSIYGCHSSGKKYTKMSMIKHSGKDYEYATNILVVGVPSIE